MFLLILISVYHYFFIIKHNIPPLSNEKDCEEIFVQDLLVMEVGDRESMLQ